MRGNRASKKRSLCKELERVLEHIGLEIDSAKKKITAGPFYIFTSPCYFECMYTPILDTFRCQPRLSSKSSPCESLPSWCKQRPTHFNQKAVKGKHTSIARWSRKWCFLLITTVKHALRPKRLLSMSLIKGIRIQLAATASWQASAPRLRA